MVQRLGFVLSGIKLRQVKELVETAVIRKYVRWCERTAVKAASYSITPGEICGTGLNYTRLLTVPKEIEDK